MANTTLNPELIPAFAGCAEDTATFVRVIRAAVEEIVAGAEASGVPNFIEAAKKLEAEVTGVMAVSAMAISQKYDEVATELKLTAQAMGL